MKASWQEGYFKALIRLRLLLSVNPKTGTQKCDRCHIVARREPRGPLAYRAEMLGLMERVRVWDDGRLRARSFSRKVCKSGVSYETKIRFDAETERREYQVWAGTE